MPVFAPIIAALISALGWMFKSQIGQWILSAMVALGISFTVSQFAIDPILTQIRNSASGISGEALDWIRVFRIDQYITIILSAYAVSAGKRVLLARRATP